MLLKPSQSLKAIEHSRKIIKNTIERVRNIYAAIQEYRITPQELVDAYNKDNRWHKIKLPENNNVSYGVIGFWEGYSNSEFLDNCEKEIKILKAFNEQGLKQKPKEELIASVRDSLIAWSSQLATITIFFAMNLDEELAACDIELNKFKNLCEALIKYRVSDSDYMKIYLNRQYRNLPPDEKTLSTQIAIRQKELEEALDLVSVIEATYKDYKPYRKKWIFNIPVPMDENLKVLLNVLLDLYARIVDH